MFLAKTIQASEEKRRSNRVPCHFTMVLFPKEGEVNVVAKDISLCGIRTEGKTKDKRVKGCFYDSKHNILCQVTLERVRTDGDDYCYKIVESNSEFSLFYEICCMEYLGDIAG